MKCFACGYEHFMREDGEPERGTGEEEFIFEGPTLRGTKIMMCPNCKTLRGT